MAGPQLGDLEPPDDRDELTADVTLVSLQGALPDAAGALVFEPPVQYTASRTRFGQGSPAEHSPIGSKPATWPGSNTASTDSPGIPRSRSRT